MSKWADSSQHTGEAYSARAAALLASWQQSAAHFKTASAKLADAESKRVAAAINQLEHHAAQFRDTCAMLQKAGSSSWMAVGQALHESRSAFEAAARQVQAQFKNATENPPKAP